ncbi:MAG: hypothetical protein JWL90_4351 [Chthoniobacteraceae bacterium]|nr:hypothetical protein [Chthoniobacteraceae bacterium]
MTTLTFKDELTLLGFLSGQGQALTTAKLRSALKPVLRQQSLDFSTLLPRLAELALIEELPRQPRTRSSRWRLAPPGHESMQARLGEGSTRGRGWMMKAARALASGRTLGVTSRMAVTIAGQPDALATFYLATRLGLEFQPGMTTLGLARELAASELGVTNARAETLWNGLIERALGTKAAEENEPCSIEPFSIQVQRAARTATHGWFGPGKLFIHHAWETWRRKTGDPLDLPEFKKRLLAALRAGELGLTRADFTPVLDPIELAQAEIRDGVETFHFLTIEQTTP